MNLLDFLIRGNQIMGLTTNDIDKSDITIENIEYKKEGENNRVTGDVYYLTIKVAKRFPYYEISDWDEHRPDMNKLIDIKDHIKNSYNRIP